MPLVTGSAYTANAVMPMMSRRQMITIIVGTCDSVSLNYRVISLQNRQCLPIWESCGNDIMASTKNEIFTTVPRLYHYDFVDNLLLPNETFTTTLCTIISVSSGRKRFALTTCQTVEIQTNLHHMVNPDYLHWALQMWHAELDHKQANQSNSNFQLYVDAQD